MPRPETDPTRFHSLPKWAQEHIRWQDNRIRQASSKLEAYRGNRPSRWRVRRFDEPTIYLQMDSQSIEVDLSADPLDKSPRCEIPVQLRVVREYDNKLALEIMGCGVGRMSIHPHVSNKITVRFDA